ncbi:cyclic nucleotide-binding domain-containing protein [Sandaracinus amylolyticus]|uniref:Serine/threonine phosphatase PrpC, regulation of stationary phase n=1 Tax=Sandaracinus amylolyticus TaxID=927083 RepID=A0A0F6YLL7_9BACT|nr:cyclic nucleotide-binding domain-containing protein [Sandaracinus amylolyticus]AKF09607.1 serine/threonine phosphatase PrpC, regulation of stationary phase [Sandaracinus amylolyticus]
MQIHVASATDVGRERTLNEDFCLVDPALGLYIVCDGMGGHAAGEIASRTAASTVQAYVRDRQDVLRAIDRGEQPIESAAVLMREAVETASRTIYEMGKNDRGKKGMGTTCVALLVRGGKGVMAHVGDSRLYLVRQARLYQLSEDHTFIQEALRCGMLTPEQAKQSEHHNIVTRAVGPLERVIVDTLVFDMIVDDTLLLCSDGLHGYLGEGQELPTLLSTADLDAVSRRLVDLANQRGGSDNITAVVLRASAHAASREEDAQRTTIVNQTFETLQHVDLFVELTMPELVRVSNACRCVELGAGEVVIGEGEASETLFLLIDGAVEVVRSNVRLAELGPGSHFGEMALLSQRPRSATVRTTAETRLLALDRQQFYGLLQQDPVLAGKFLWKLAQTLSLRLDDFYLYHEQVLGMPVKSTLRFGLYPSPFNHPAGSGSGQT